MLISSVQNAMGRDKILSYVCSLNVCCRVLYDVFVCFDIIFANPIAVFSEPRFEVEPRYLISIRYLCLLSTLYYRGIFNKLNLHIL